MGTKGRNEVRDKGKLYNGCRKVLYSIVNKGLDYLKTLMFLII